MRKLLIRAALACAAAFALAGAASAQGTAAPAGWPQQKPIRIVVGFGAGSQPDLFARLYGDRLATALGGSVVIENKPGGAGNLATETVAHAPADGYTLLYSPPTAITVNPSLYRSLPFDVQKDLTPVAQTVSAYLTLIVNNDLPIRSVSDLIGYARAHPGQLAFGSYGAGGFPHLMMVWIMNETGTDMLHVPYRAGASPDLIGGRIQILAEPSAPALALSKAGKVRAIAFSGSERHPSMPDLPTVSETLPGVVVDGWQGIWAPAGTPRAIVERINAEIAKINQDPEIQQKVLSSTARPLTNTPERMAEMIRKETALWRGLIQKNNIRPE